MSDAASYLLFTNADGQPNLDRLRHFLRRYAIETVKRGASTLVVKASLEAHLNRQQPVAARRQRSGDHLQFGHSGFPHARKSAKADAGSPLNSLEGGER